MSGIKRPIVPDSRISLISRHLPGTAQVERLLRKEGKAHVFNNVETMQRVTEAIVQGGARTGENDLADSYERYGLYFTEAIGYILKNDGSQTPLHYGEVKIIKTTGEYHAIPRTGPRRTR